MIEKTILIKLTDALNAVITIQRCGQEKPYNGDRVRVITKIYLPTNKNDRTAFLNDELEFGSKCTLFGHHLSYNFGYYADEIHGDLSDHRYIMKDFYASTWVEAFNLAENITLAEIKKLTDMLAVRHQSLIDAEK